MVKKFKYALVDFIPVSFPGDQMLPFCCIAWHLTQLQKVSFFFNYSWMSWTGKVKDKPVKTIQIQLENTPKWQQFPDVLGERTGQKINGI